MARKTLKEGKRYNDVVDSLEALKSQAYSAIGQLVAIKANLAALRAGVLEEEQFDADDVAEVDDVLADIDDRIADLIEGG